MGKMGIKKSKELLIYQNLIFVKKKQKVPLNKKEKVK